MFNKKLIFLNLVFFSIIIGIVIYHYLSHFDKLQKEISSYVEIQAKSIAKRIEIAASNVYRSHRFVKTIIANSLKSQAKLIDLLNSIEPFKKQELQDFAEEAGLNIVCIISKKRKICNGNYPNLSVNGVGIKFLPEKNLILYYYKGEYSNAIVITGILAEKFFKKQRKFSLNSLIHRILIQRQDINDIKIVNGKIKKIEITLMKNRFFLVKIPFEAEKDKIILIKIDAHSLLNILENFKHNLHVFIFVIILLGIIGNFFIYFIQKKYLNEIRSFEKKIAQNEKFAAIGRSAGIIAHEIRNPLNAIGIGLQRILYETDIAEHQEYRELLNTILNELKKVNEKITIFIDYTKPIQIKKNRENLKKLIEEGLIFYKNLKLKISLNIPEDVTVNVDKNFFMQVISNILRNVFENKEATYLDVKCYKKGKEIFLIFENDGVSESIDEEKIFEPYFTTKTKGSGLGLPIAKKIIEAHNGEIFCKIYGNKIKFIIKLVED